MLIAEQNPQLTRARILVRGIVQGVGFRPFVYALAKRHALKGRVHNNSAGVQIDVEGEDQDIEQFIKDLNASAPPLSLIESIERDDIIDAANFEDFRIIESDSQGEKFVPVSADVATCADCLRELFASENRRYRYPFINCTNCGPRFTIIEGIPYDRERTTMRSFEMCAACRAEYENPLDRRFHAEPTACALCGPQLFLKDAGGLLIASDKVGKEGAINQTRSLLMSGKIVAIKGLGGFHLAVDALNGEAVERLRQSKYREDKPFALMVQSVDVVREYCAVSDSEAELLLSARRPVVLLEKLQDAASLPADIAPRVGTLGFMLPYTPLHHLLFENFDWPLVMTSGNISDEPIAFEDRDATARLRNIADYFLLHDRPIHMRADDSVTRVYERREMVLRRARGYAPAPVKTAFKFEREILACGAELKNTFCLTRDHYAFVSHHIGNLENFETLQSFTQGIEHFKRLFYLEPEVIAYDLHPEYLSTKYALALDDHQHKIGVQHHHAHIASCMADNMIEGEVIGVAMDGLGYGADGRLWGGEFFVAELREAERVAHLEYIPMPGGAKAIREPWRMAAVYLQRAMGDDFLKTNLPFVQDMDRRAWTTLRRMIATGTNSPETSSMGRLFDAVSSLLGLRSVVYYEGQAAIELEAIVYRSSTEKYEIEFDLKEGIIKTDVMIRRAVDDLLDGVPVSKISAKFHRAVVELIATVARNVRNERDSTASLCRAVFFKHVSLRENLRVTAREGFEVFTHHRVPTNDGGVSFGQAAVANALLTAGRI